MPDRETTRAKNSSGRKCIEHRDVMTYVNQGISEHCDMTFKIKTLQWDVFLKKSTFKTGDAFLTQDSFLKIFFVPLYEIGQLKIGQETSMRESE